MTNPNDALKANDWAILHQYLCCKEDTPKEVCTALTKLRQALEPRPAVEPCETCKDIPEECAKVPNSRHCEKSQRNDVDRCNTSTNECNLNLSQDVDVPVWYESDLSKSIAHDPEMVQGALAVLSNLMMKSNATIANFNIGNKEDGDFYFTGSRTPPESAWQPETVDLDLFKSPFIEDFDDSFGRLKNAFIEDLKNRYAGKIIKIKPPSAGEKT